MKAIVNDTSKRLGYPRLVKGQAGDVFILLDKGAIAVRISGVGCSGLSFKTNSIEFEPFNGTITLSNE